MPICPLCVRTMQGHLSDSDLWFCFLCGTVYSVSHSKDGWTVLLPLIPEEELAEDETAR